MTAEQLEKTYTYHPPSNKVVHDLDQKSRYEVLRGKAKSLAIMINDYCPESREKSLAFTKLEEVIMWANASIARNE